MPAHLLDRVPFLAGLSVAQRHELAAMFDVRRLDANEVVFWVGEMGDEFFIVQHGRVQITVPDLGGKEIVLAELGDGAPFGEIALLDQGPRTATARACAPTTLLALDRASFAEFVTRYPVVAMHFLKVLGGRQRETVEKLRGIRNLNEVIDERMTPWQRIAAMIAAMASSKLFLLTHATVFGLWIIGNSLLGQRGIDPFPFSFLCFWASVEAIFLSLFILVAQDQQTRKDRARTELEYQVALKTQVELMQLHQKMDRVLEAVPALARSAEEDGRSTLAEALACGSERESSVALG